AKPKVGPRTCCDDGPVSSDWIIYPAASRMRTNQHSAPESTTMADELYHFIGGKRVKGTSGRFGDVYWPMTGEIAARVPLASQDEVRAAVENAKAAQPAWAASYPQRRARVLMRFIELVARDNEKLADKLAREHGKTMADARGDIQRGIEVAE